MILGIVTLFISLLGIVSCNGKLPEVFSSHLRFIVPFSNLTQEIIAYVNLETEEAHIGYYDEDPTTHALKEYDYTIWGREGNGYTYLNGRTKINEIICENHPPGSHMVNPMKTQLNENSSYEYVYPTMPVEIDSLIPDDLTQFTLMNEKVSIHGRMMSHYRYTASYKPTYPDIDDNSYVDKRFYQQNFYCLEDSVTGYCIPHVWDMQSISNFGSHYDLYRVEYVSFTAGAITDEHAFDTPKECENLPDPDPIDPDGPVGPTIKKVSTLPHKLLNYHARIVRKNESTKTHENITLLNNMRKIQEWNSRPGIGYTTGLNRFATMDYSEAYELFTGRRPAKNLKEVELPIFEYTYDIELPKSIDWRVSGVDGPVKDQCACGSCWVFGAIGSVEGRLNKKRLEDNKYSTPLVRISEQAILSCFWDPDNQSCNGGDSKFALKSIVDNGGKLTLESKYPYKGMDMDCRKDLFEFIDDKYRVCNPKRVKVGSLNALKRALVDGPVEVSIAVPESLLYYTGGIYNPPISECGNRQEDLAHGVTAVGYGVDETYGEYIIIKNSWSPLWGSDGYAYIAVRNNTCGILTDATFAEICSKE